MFIPDPDFFTHPGSRDQKAPDPGSGSATLVVDRYHVDVDPVPHPTYHIDADPNTNPTPSFTHFGKCWKIRIFLNNYSHFFVVIVVIIYNIIMDIILNFLGKSIL